MNINDNIDFLNFSLEVLIPPLKNGSCIVHQSYFSTKYDGVS
ncbi:hypothetical protein [Clostridioides difficile]|nr:hypothetical protein [Clostridioides difficile]